MSVSPENLVGIVLFFTVCGLAIRYINDSRIRAIAFLSALLASAWMAGFIRTEHLQGLFQRISDAADPIGVWLSGFMISAGTFSPIPQLRKPLITAGATGLAASLMGIPVWITWIILVLAVIIVGYLIYRAVKSIIQTIVGG